MIEFELAVSKTSIFRVLCLGSHCDDIEIGCGGTILKLIEQLDNLAFRWVVFGSHEVRAAEALCSAGEFLKGAKEKSVSVEKFRDGFFPYIGVQIKEYFEALKQEFTPDIIFTHYRQDLHQDHRFISELTWNTFRDHLILEYEIPKYDGDLGSPNVFVPLDQSLCQRKIEYILNNFETQRENHWFTEDTFLSLLRLRGVESNSQSKYAEAFYSRKLILK